MLAVIYHVHHDEENFESQNHLDEEPHEVLSHDGS
jgi:hypothetical protein